MAAPTRSPAEDSQERVASRVAGAGPNSAAASSGVR